MKAKTARYLILYGGFLMMMGLAGYWSNPEKARTALISGGTFGALSILWGVLGAKGVRWSLPGALITTGLLAAVFVWRASVGWLAVFAGQPEKQFAAALITSMLAASVLMLAALFRSVTTRPPANPPAPEKT